MITGPMRAKRLVGQAGWGSWDSDPGPPAQNLLLTPRKHVVSERLTGVASAPVAWHVRSGRAAKSLTGCQSGGNLRCSANPP